MLENGDMKGKRSCLYTQNSLWVAIIGLLGQVLTLLHLVSSGEFMSFDNFAVTSAFWNIFYLLLRR